MTQFPLGPVVLVVEHRMPGPEGGPTLRVLGAADGHEWLRFDAFAKEPHWHADPGGRDEFTRLPRAVDALDWTEQAVRGGLEGLLAKAGYRGAALPGATEREPSLTAALAALRNPPVDFDDLDVGELRARSGEKWRTYPEDVLALWVADMDFWPAEPIRWRLQRALDFGELGYPMHPAPTPLPGVFAERAKRRHGWDVDPSRIEILTDVMQGVYVGIERFTEPGDGVVIQTPIYPPFLAAVRETGRRLLENPLREGANGFELDVETLERLAPDARMLLLCNPHNPTGRVFREDELRALADVAERHDLVIVSDEIHADLVHPEHTHRPVAALDDATAARTLTLVSASKAFNIAGLRTALGVFGTSEMQARYRECLRHVRGGIGSLGIEITLAAFRHADPWLEAVRAQLRRNRDLVADFVASELPGVRHHRPEATYLAWLDCRALDLPPDPYRFFLEHGKVALSNGKGFGPPGAGHVRINFATSRAILEGGLERMARALRER